MTRNSLLCPNCNKLVSRDEIQCPYCGLKHPGAIWKHNFLVRGFSDGEDLVRTIIWINAGFYILSLLFYMPGMNFSSPFNALAPNYESLRLLGATGTWAIDQKGYWWTLLSANYLHGSLLHILFNMMALRQIGILSVRLYGTYRTITIYTLTGIAGFAVSYFAHVRMTIGASAALCGLIGAALYYGKSRGGTFGQAIYKHTSGWVIGLFFIGLMPGINNWGHGGGLVAGIGTGYLFSYLERRPENFLDKFLAALCVLATVAVLLWAVGSGLYLRLGT